MREKSITNHVPSMLENARSLLIDAERFTHGVYCGDIPTRDDLESARFAAGDALEIINELQGILE